MRIRNRSSEAECFRRFQDDDATAYTDGVLESMLGLSLPLFQEAANFCGRVNRVVLNVVQQFVSLYARDSRFAAGWGGVRLKPVLSALGDMLAVLVTMDAIVRENRLIGMAWERYKRVADVISSDPAKYGVDAGAAAAFPQLLLALDRTVISGQMLRGCLNQSYDLAMAQVLWTVGGKAASAATTPSPAASSPALPFQTGSSGSGAAAWVALCDGALDLVDSLMARLGAEDEQGEAIQVRGGRGDRGRGALAGPPLPPLVSPQVVGQFAIYALFRTVTMRVAPDKRAFDRLWRTQERLPMVVLTGKTAWAADAFLVEYAPIPDIPLNRLTPKVRAWGRGHS